MKCSCSTSIRERCTQQSYLLHTPYFFLHSRKKDFLQPTKSSVFLAWLFQVQLYYLYTNFWGHCYFFVREDQSLKFHDCFFVIHSGFVSFYFPERGTSDISKQHICCVLAQKKLRSCLCTFPQKRPPKLAALKIKNLISQKHKDTNYFKARPCKIKPTIKLKRLESEI